MPEGDNNDVPTPAMAHEAIQYNVFLNPDFYHDGDGDELSTNFENNFKKHKAVDFNLPLTITIYAVVSVYNVARCSFTTLWWLQEQHGQHATPFYLSFFMFVASAIMAHIIMLSRVHTRSYFEGLPALQIFHQWALDLTNHRFHGATVENACMLSLTAAFAVHMLGRTLVGQCPAGTTLWSQQSCNPLADRHAVPADMYLVTFIAPLIPQIFLKGATRGTILASWVICAVFLNASHAVAGAALDMYAWINMGFVILMGISHEYERMQLLTFLAKKQNDADIENRLKASHELEESKLAALEADMKTKRAMVRHIGHELRNPMNTIQGSLEVLQQELKPFQALLPPDIFDNFTTCRESCSLVRDTVSDLVSFEKIAAGLYYLELSFVSVLKYIDDCTRPSMIEARAKDITFVLQKESCAESTVIHIDPLKMAQVFRNLFSNAVKFTKRGGEVVVTISERDSQVRVAVTDQGPGLTADQISHLFQEGVQFDANKHQNGYVVICDTISTCSSIVDLPLLFSSLTRHHFAPVSFRLLL